MAYGFSVTNANGFVQIDDTLSNFCIYQSGALANENQLYVVLSGFNPVTDLLFLGTDHMTSQFFVAGGDYVFSYANNYPGGKPPIHYLWLRTMSSMPISNTGYGLAVYDANNLPVFSSNQRYINFVYQYNGAPALWTPFYLPTSTKIRYWNVDYFRASGTSQAYDTAYPTALGVQQETRTLWYMFIGNISEWGFYADPYEYYPESIHLPPTINVTVIEVS